MPGHPSSLFQATDLPVSYTHLDVYKRQSFDVVLQIDTLQHLRNAEVMLRETVRVGRIGICLLYTSRCV